MAWVGGGRCECCSSRCVKVTAEGTSMRNSWHTRHPLPKPTGRTHAPSSLPGLSLSTSSFLRFIPSAPPSIHPSISSSSSSPRGFSAHPCVSLPLSLPSYLPPSLCFPFLSSSPAPYPVIVNISLQTGGWRYTGFPPDSGKLLFIKPLVGWAYFSGAGTVVNRALLDTSRWHFRRWGASHTRFHLLWWACVASSKCGRVFLGFVLIYFFFNNVVIRPLCSIGSMIFSS